MQKPPGVKVTFFFIMAYIGTGYTGEEALEEYVCAHIDSESSLLSALYRETNLHLLNPRMASGHIQGRLLKMLTSMIKPRTVLEIGTFSGYSAICMAEGLPEGGILHTFECDDELEDFIAKWIARSGYQDRIIQHTGDVLRMVPAMGLDFDMVFIDGDKRQYPDYYMMAMEHLAAGGYIIADNTLWNGHVISPQYDNDAQTAGIRRFNDLVVSDERVEVSMIPIRDGLTLIRNKE